MNKKIEEVKRYTLYTQLLNGIVTIGALVIIGLIIVDPSRLTEPDWVMAAGCHWWNAHIRRVHLARRLYPLD